MKLILIGLSAIAMLSLGTISVQAQPMTKEQAATDCFTQYKASPEERKLVDSKDFLEKPYASVPKSLQCYSLCYYKKMGMLGADGKFNEKETEAALTRLSGDKTKAQAIFKECKELKGANECEKMFNFGNCVHF